MYEVRQGNLYLIILVVLILPISIPMIAINHLDFISTSIYLEHRLLANPLLYFPKPLSLPTKLRWVSFLFLFFFSPTSDVVGWDRFPHSVFSVTACTEDVYQEKRKGKKRVK